jgi:small subunit ribosomal protein S20
MANTRSAEKNIRKTKARTIHNKAIGSRLRTFRKRVMDAIAKGDMALVSAEFGLFSSVADKAAKTNVIHKNKASRIKSRVSARIRKLRDGVVTPVAAKKKKKT